MDILDQAAIAIFYQLHIKEAGASRQIRHYKTVVSTFEIVLACELNQLFKELTILKPTS